MCKVDLEGTGDPAEGECLLLARDGPEDEEFCTGREGITQMVAQDDSFVWTASGSSSIKRWRDVAPRSKRAGAIALRRKEEKIQEAKQASEVASSITPDPEPTPESPPSHAVDRERSSTPSVSFLEGLTTGLERTSSTPTARSTQSASAPTNRPSSLRTRPSANSSASQTSRPHMHVHRSSTGIHIPGNSTTLFDVPYDSLIPLIQPEDTYFSPAFTSRARDPDAATIYSSASVLSVPHFGMHRPSMSTSPPSSSFRRPQSVRSIGEAQDSEPTNIARREYLERDGCNEATPLRTAPDEVIAGRHGLVRCELLSDRRHALTVDTEDEVALWDIVRGRCVGVFAPDELAMSSRRPSDAISSISGSGSNGSDSVNGADVLEYVKERIEGEAAILTWCKCDTRVGSLTVHLEEARVFDGEVYADEAIPSAAEDLPPDHRLSLGKWVLRNLFDVSDIDPTVSGTGLTLSVASASSKLSWSCVPVAALPSRRCRVRQQTSRQGQRLDTFHFHRCRYQRLPPTSNHRA